VTTALSGDLYRTLGAQLALLTVAAIGLAWVVRRRRLSVSIPAPAAEAPARRLLRICLGLLWVIDGLLQVQPGMPDQFTQRVVAPELATAPTWLVHLVDPFLRVWLLHPVAADAAVIWVQVGLGLALLVGGRGRLARLVVLAAISWAVFVWVVGEVLGGLTDPVASWLNGAPGAALLYAAAGGLLVLPQRVWDVGTAARWSRRTVGVAFLGGAALQAWPRDGGWGTSAAQVFSEAADGGIPSALALPIRLLADSATVHPVAVNAVIVVALAVVGAALVADVFPRAATVCAVILAVAGWWLGQGFGIFGGLATDPQTGAITLVLLATGWPRPASHQVPDGVDRTVAPTTWPQVLAGCAAALAVLVLPVVAAAGLLRPVSAQAAIGDSGGATPVAATSAPDFTLVDQHGHELSMRDLRGHLVLVAFLDPECLDSCPLLANQLVTAVASLGSAASSVAIVAIDVNPVFNHVADVAAFTRAHGLAHVSQWHFVTGSHAQIGAVLAAYGEGITVPAVGMIGHPQDVYLYGRDGRALSVLFDSANEDLTTSYVRLISDELRQHL